MKATNFSYPRAPPKKKRRKFSTLRFFNGREIKQHLLER